MEQEKYYQLQNGLYECSVDILISLYDLYKPEKAWTWDLLVDDGLSARIISYSEGQKCFEFIKEFKLKPTVSAYIYMKRMMVKVL